MNAGGLIFRCRWCENGYCEDCLDWERTALVGESLPELEMLGFGAVEQAFWIKCAHCAHRHDVDPAAAALCADMVREWAADRAAWDAAALTHDGATVEGSEAPTPGSTADESRKRRRKSAASTPARPPKKARAAAPKTATAKSAPHAADIRAYFARAEVAVLDDSPVAEVVELSDKSNMEVIELE